jgi:hypothetical protein
MRLDSPPRPARDLESVWVEGCAEIQRGLGWDTRRRAAGSFRCVVGGWVADSVWVEGFTEVQEFKSTRVLNWTLPAVTGAICAPVTFLPALFNWTMLVGKANGAVMKL